MTTVRARLAGAIAAVLLSATANAGASAPANAAPVALGEAVSVSGSSSFVRDVTLPRAVTLSYTTWSQTVTIHAGRGRFAGFALQPVDRRVTGAMLWIQPGYCAAVGCATSPWAFHGGLGCLCGVTSDNTATATFPAGRYRLYLIADGGPVRATFHLPGLHGSTAVRAGGRASVSIDAPRPSQLAPSMTDGFGGNLYSAGLTHQSGPRGGVYFVLGWKLIVGAPKSVDLAGPCVWQGSAGGVAAPYQYPCDAGSATALGVSGQVEAGSTAGPGGALAQYATFYEGFGVHAGGHVSAGGYVDSEAPATEVHTLVLWLDFG